MEDLSAKTPSKSWDSMSKMERRVAIAQDVIDRLRTNKYRAKSEYGYFKIARKWVRGNFTPSGQVKNDTQLQDVLKKGALCTVCAKGAMFAAHVERNNNFKLCELGVDYRSIYRTSDAGLVAREIQTDNQLNDCFDKTCLDLIECAFEGAVFAAIRGRNFYKPQSEYMAAAANMFDNKTSPKQRLTRICENIIANKGKFVIPGCGSF